MLMAVLQAKADVLNIETSGEPRTTSRSIRLPPLASPLRRAKSYTEFHHIVGARRRKHQDEGLARDSNPVLQIKDEAAFDKWFDGLSDDLIESTHVRYRSEHSSAADPPSPDKGLDCIWIS